MIEKIIGILFVLIMCKYTLSYTRLARKYNAESEGVIIFVLYLLALKVLKINFDSYVVRIIVYCITVSVFTFFGSCMIGQYINAENNKKRE